MSSPSSPKYRILLTYNYEWADISFRSDEIVEVRLLAKAYSKQKVTSVIDKIKELSGRESLLVLIITDPKSTVTFDGIKAVFSKSAISYSVAKAYVFHTRLQFFLARAGHFVFKPKTPIRFFNDKTKAETWLSSFQGYGM
jgi:hypothetical protein